MKKCLFSVFYIYATFFSSYGQDSKIKDSVLNMYQQVQTFDYNPRFILDFSAYYCTYQVLINDVPVMNSNVAGNVNGAVYPFSQFVLNSGKQTITIRLYPAMQEGYKRDAFLKPNSGMTIKVQEGDYIRQKPDNYKTIYSFETPEIKGDNIPFIEFKGEFEAKVPRVLEGWTKGVDLSKENKDQLLKEVVAKYEEFRQCFEKKDACHLATMLYKRQLEFSKAYYQIKPEQSIETWEKLESMVYPVISMFPIEKYRMVFYGDQKIVGLERVDAKYDRENIVIAQKKGMKSWYSMILYRPKSGAPLEVIR